MFATTGILFNHESPLRPERFVTKKIISAACRISKGSEERLELGNIDIRRDWGWAPEYVDAMWRILNQDDPQDYIIATGKTQSLKDFLNTAFEALNLDWHDHVTVNSKLMRPTDPYEIMGLPLKAEKKLGWKPKIFGPDLVKKLIQYELNLVDCK